MLCYNSNTYAFLEWEKDTNVVEVPKRGAMTIEEGTKALGEYRRIRGVQDKEYEEMLRADKDKVLKWL